MMMKILGAALIVSGGIIFGKTRAMSCQRHLAALMNLGERFGAFEVALRERRGAVKDFLRVEDGAVYDVQGNCQIYNLQPKEIEQLNGVLCQLQTGSYQESIAVCTEYFKKMNQQIDTVKEESANIGRTYPLVSGAIAFIVVVLLF